MANSKRVAILMADGFEEVEYTRPRKALDEAGVDVHVVSLKGGTVKAWAKTDWGDTYDVDTTVAKATADDYDLLLLPGGVMNPDELRQDEDAVAFVQAFAKAGKPIAAICHAPWLLVEADVVKGKTVTSYPSLATDLENAGATHVDREVVEDGGLITSRNPGDIPAFNAAVLAALGVKDAA